MTPHSRRLGPLVATLAMLLGACAAGASPSPSATETTPHSPTANPSPTATEEPTPSPTAEPTAEPTATATAAPTSMAGPGGLAIEPHPQADALFADRDECENRRDGYRVEFPDDWWTNTEIGRQPPCIWFSPTFYQVPDPTVVPDEIAIAMEYVQGATGSTEELLSTEEVLVGGQPAVRSEWTGARGEGGQMPADWRRYVYEIQLGPTRAEGPNLVVSTTTEMGGDYDLNRAVMDRMMATMEFFGTIQ